MNGGKLEFTNDFPFVVSPSTLLRTGLAKHERGFSAAWWRGGVAMADVETHRMPIGGEWVESESGKTMETINPATGEKLGEVPLANGSDVDRAVQAAKRAFRDWSRLQPKDRGKKIGELGKRIASRVEEIARLETLNTGSPLEGMRGDVLSNIETLEDYAGLAYQFQGQTIPGAHGRVN